MSPTPTREQWRTVLDDTDLPTFGELVSAIEATDLFAANPIGDILLLEVGIEAVGFAGAPGLAIAS